MPIFLGYMGSSNNVRAPEKPDARLCARKAVSWDGGTVVAKRRPTQGQALMKLMCPICSNCGEFIIHAEMNVTVLGHDCFLQIDPSEVSDIAYGDQSACTCATCGHLAPINNFLDPRSSMFTSEDYAANRHIQTSNIVSRLSATPPSKRQLK